MTGEQQKNDKELRDKQKEFREQYGKESVKIHGGKVIRVGKNGENTKEILYDPKQTNVKEVQ